MHNLLQLKGAFNSQRIRKPSGPRTLKKNESVTSSHLQELIHELENIRAFWQEHTEIQGALVSVHYSKVVAKSNRIQLLLKDGSRLPGDSVCGARFRRDTDGRIKNHIITYFVSVNALTTTIGDLQAAKTILDKQYHGSIHADETKTISSAGIPGTTMKKTHFLNILVDSYYVDHFVIDSTNHAVHGDSIISIYKTGVDTKELLRKFGIQIFDDRIINTTTLQLHQDEITKLQDEAPYLIAMALTDLTRIAPDYSATDVTPPEEFLPIPHPQNEPVIGVIDTQFDTTVYFHEWVEYHNMLDNAIEIHPEDKRHGTAVDSILVDGPRGNPRLEDQCGHFRVRHFGVCTAGKFSSFEVLRMIRNIVSSNRDIKVWNLSLGSDKEIPVDFISPEAAELDRIQSDYDVIFVVAGTNLTESNPHAKRIGAPADSLNAIVVNAVNFESKPASYTREGPVLSFFHKPDISYYGGDGSLAEGQIVVCRDTRGASYVSGTSFAAPWITRKLAYLIYVLGFTRELAKAILIDSAASWNQDASISDKTGYGIVPTDIHTIIRTPNDEIKFMITGQVKDYETFNYNLPIPTDANGYPFFAKATMCYFPYCSRNQGVDYTGTEIDLHIGRLQPKESKDKKVTTITVKDIKGNKQADPGLNVIYEQDARIIYYKWDNVKHISENIPAARYRRPRKILSADKLWGIRLITTERSYTPEKKPLPFGLVVTLKEMKGKDRMADFVKLCQTRGWIVNEINIENQLDIYEKAEEDIDLQ